MANGSTVEGKSAAEVEKLKYRFSGTKGQTQGPCKSLPHDFIPEAPGTYPYPIHKGGTENA